MDEDFEAQFADELEALEDIDDGKWGEHSKKLTVNILGWFIIS